MEVTKRQILRNVKSYSSFHIMNKEFETKVLDIDIKEIKEKLTKLNAKQDEEVLMRRWVFDIDPKNNKWIRLRDNGKKVTLTYKCKTGSGISETEEIEVEVSNFEKTADILSKLQFENIYYQENKRKVFTLNDIEYAIDSWPKIPAYLEIESHNEEKVKEGLALLSLENKAVGNLSVVGVYQKYGIDLHFFKNLRF